MSSIIYLKREIIEEMKEKEEKEKHLLFDEENTDDEEMHGIGWKIFHKKLVKKDNQ